MSIRPPFAVLIGKPGLQAAAGAAVLFGLPVAQVALSSTIPGVGAAGALPLYGLNIISFAINCSTVSVPGRLDGTQDASMRKGNLNPDTLKGKQPGGVSSAHAVDLYAKARDRSLVSPSGWAFAIWAPIYLGESLFCVLQCVPSLGLTQTILPHISAPFAAVNLFQSLWCASFRSESFNGTWTTFISPAMLAGAAYSMSHVNAYAAGNMVLVPLSMHFGWLTAATLVNLNSSLAAFYDNERLTVAAGHASAVLACVLGVGVTLSHATPVYGLTIAWALTACGTGMASRIRAVGEGRSSLAAKVQKYLCFAGAGVCAATSLALLLPQN